MQTMTIQDQLEHYARRHNWLDEDIKFVIQLLGAAYEDGYYEGYADAGE